MRWLVNIFVTSFVCLLPFPSFAFSGDLDLNRANNRDIAGLFAKVNPAYLGQKALDNLARSVFCNDLRQAKNEFDRREIAESIVRDMTESSQNASGIVKNVTITYSLNEYDFSKNGFSVSSGRYHWQNARQIFRLDYGNPSLVQDCWFFYNQAGGVPHILNFWPEKGQIVGFVPVEPTVARQLVQNGRPQYQIKFDLMAERLHVEPLGSPKYQLAGKMKNIRAALVDGGGKELLDISYLYNAGSQRIYNTETKNEENSADSCMDCGDDLNKEEHEKLIFSKKNIEEFFYRTVFSPDIKAESAEFIIPRLYAKNVMYYRKSQSRDAVVKDKKGFYSRWTNRSYVMDRSTLKINKEGNRRKVSFKFKYEVSGPQGERRGAGIASYELAANPEDDSLMITAEDSKTE